MTYGSDFMGAITNDWLEVLNPQFGMPYYKKLYDTVKREYSTHVVYPPADDILNALNFTPFIVTGIFFISSFIISIIYFNKLKARLNIA